MSRLIDADALIHELNNSHYPGAPYIDAGISIAIGKVCDAPTIEPERETGRWMPTEPDAPCFYRCDHCGRLLDFPECFCPTCGTDMRGEQDG